MAVNNNAKKPWRNPAGQMATNVLSVDTIRPAVFAPKKPFTVAVLLLPPPNQFEVRYHFPRFEPAAHQVVPGNVSDQPVQEQV